MELDKLNNNLSGLSEKGSGRALKGVPIKNLIQDPQIELKNLEHFRWSYY